MRLSDIVNKSSTFEDLTKLEQELFEITPEDMLTLGHIGRNYRNQQEGKRKHYDYSVEVNVFLTYVLHTMKREGLSEELCNGLKEVKSHLTRYYQETPNQGSDSPHSEETTKIAERIMKSEDGQRFLSLVRKSFDDFDKAVKNINYRRLEKEDVEAWTDMTHINWHGLCDAKEIFERFK